MPLIPLSNSEVSTAPSRELPRLAIAIAIPREVDTLAGGAAAARGGSEAKMRTFKARDKNISSRTVERFVGAHLWFGNDYEPREISGTFPGLVLIFEGIKRRWERVGPRCDSGTPGHSDDVY